MLPLFGFASEIALGRIFRRKAAKPAGFDGDAPNVNGTVGEDGAFGGTIGFQPLRGQFTRDEFEGAFKSFNCEWKALLRRTR